MRRKIALLLITIFVFFASYGQRIPKKIEKKYQEVELFQEAGYKRYKVKNNGRWGLLDDKGNEVLSCCFDWLYISSTYAGENSTFYIVTKLDGKEGLYDINGKKIFPFIYKSASLRYEQDSQTFYVAVKKDEKYGICQMDGKEIIPCIYEQAFIKFDKDSKYLYAQVKNGGKYGICQMDGKEIIPCIYEQAFIKFDKDSKYLYAQVKKEGKYGICQMDDKGIIPCIYEQAYVSFDKDSKYLYAQVKKEGKYGICQMDGKEIIPCIYENVYVSSTTEGIPYIKISNNSKWGLCNLSGKILVPCKYEQTRLEYIKESNFYYAIVNDKEKYGICTLNGIEIVPCIYEYVEIQREETNGLLYVLKNLNGKIGISNISGDEIIPCKYNYVSMSYDEETKSNYYFAINSDDNVYSIKHFNLLGNLIYEKTLKKSQSNTTNYKSKQHEELPKLKKTAIILRILAQGMQSMNSYMNTYSSGNIYLRPDSPSYSRQKQTCSFCHGTGYNPGKERPPFYSYSDDPMTGSCEICGDKSNHYHKSCPSCRGKGYK